MNSKFDNTITQCYFTLTEYFTLKLIVVMHKTYLAKGQVVYANITKH